MAFRLAIVADARAGDNLILEEIVFFGAHFEYSAQHFNMLPLDVFSEEKSINYYFICNKDTNPPNFPFNSQFPICHFIASKPPDNNAFSH